MAHQKWRKRIPNSTIDTRFTLSHLTSFFLDCPELFSGLYEIREGIFVCFRLAPASVLSLCCPTSLAATHGLTSPLSSPLARDSSYCRIMHECRDPQPLSHLYCHFFRQFRNASSPRFGVSSILVTAAALPASCWFHWYNHLRIHHCHHRFDHITGQLCPLRSHRSPLSASSWGPIIG